MTITVKVVNTGSSLPSINVISQANVSSKVSFLRLKGDRGEPGAQGIQGPQGAKGDTGATGAGVASGGTAGQILSKIDSTNYNTHWVTNNLDGLTDVTITSAADKQLIVYDNATGQWINADAITSSGIAYKSGVPASKTSTGQLGQLAIDGANGVLYICTGTNTWQKVSLNSANFTNAGGFV